MKKLEERKRRAAKLVKKLKSIFPEAKMVLNYSNNWELLVAVVLSAQCTDKMVNKVTEKLFKKYKTLEDYIAAKPLEFEQDIKSTGFYKMKAKNVLAAAKVVKEDFGGVIPRTIEEMIAIPGVGRKTANVVLGNAYGIVEGIAVDTHVKRFALRFDLTDGTTPEKIEQDLMEILPKKDWFNFTYLAIEYGRNIAPARKYDTTQDPLIAVYPKAAEGWSRA
jgi:endonuclease-3